MVDRKQRFWLIVVWNKVCRGSGPLRVQWLIQKATRLERVHGSLEGAKRNRFEDSDWVSDVALGGKRNQTFNGQSRTVKTGDSWPTFYLYILVAFTVQGLVQDFPEGHQPQRGGRLPIIRPIFAENCMKMKKNGTRGGMYVQNFCIRHCCLMYSIKLPHWGH